MISFLGTGLLGSNFVKALIKKGEQVQIWNRTAAKAKALESMGARAFDNPALAVKGASRVHLTLSDDQSVDEVLKSASPGLTPGTFIIDHTTTSAAGAASRTKYWKEQGYIYVHAPVFMGPQNALESTGVMLISGDQQVIKGLEPVLRTMTGQLVNLGPESNRAAGIKLLGNLLLMTITGGLSDLLALAKSLGIPAADVEAFISMWNPGSMIPARLKRILTGEFHSPSWELNMARKDARLMIEATQGRSPLTVIPSIAQKMDHWIEKGHGNDDWTIITKDNI
ncbi:MAG: NAD(P)-binding domain-containing protein [Bacteroidota bacterium]|nr:NAD(P)-binding domain-containing protein [Bacteroidota bacterium]MDP4215384.1 NAD(P)-binding domain-containing protein [Bacteroidota bacterium]MDP4244528.1 NAD(P)-binding domain-containing protein [Bacteroidota bacterium]MDP4256264.1 NAD(P)-binding domain-containing protein [Bacteroidota bacterium]MDP4259944.1 NAD(P)-binding domain-containing protein [Bacteroidota bacterium]